MTVAGALRDALRVYRLLWSRSVLVAAIVYALIALVQIVEHVTSGGLASLLGLIAGIAVITGPLLVQGALIYIVRNVHEGRVPESVGTLFADARSRLWRLFVAAILYALGVAFGLLLFIVPGFIVAARWSLMPAIVMLENKDVGDALRRSRELVRGHTGTVFMCLFVSGIVVAAPSFALLLSGAGFGTTTFLDFVWSSLTAPFAAHLLTVIYYKRSEFTRPVIDPAVLQWKSVWEGR